MDIFWTAILGAVFIYLMNLRKSKRLQAVIEHPKDNWRVIVFDFVIFLFMAGVFTNWVIEPDTGREAFLAGATWEGAAAALAEPKDIP